jgi:uncharacterized SAM-binding protein YcdF (DUF218 family)
MTDMIFVDDLPEAADIVVVLGSHSSRWDLDRRAERALELFRGGYATNFICEGATEVEGGNRAIGVSTAVYLAKTLIRGGIPKRDVLTSRERYFVGPLAAARRFERRQNNEVKTIIITSPLTARRLQLWGRFQAKDTQRILMCPHSQGYSSNNWTIEDGGREAVQHTFNGLLHLETNGLLTSEWRRAVLEKHGVIGGTTPSI